MLKRFWTIIAGLAVLFATPLAAETIRVPAHSRSTGPEFLTIQSISLGKFDGEDGATLSHMVEAQLAQLKSDGQPLFDIRVGGTGNDSDAVVTGSANASVEKFPAWQKREICLEKGPDKVCLKYGDVPIDCLRRVVSTNVQLRFHASIDGRVLLSNGVQRRNDRVICPDDTSGPQTVEESVAELLSNSVGSILPQFSPYLGALNVRVREETAGLSKPEIKRFKAAIKLSQKNVSAGCAEFDALYSLNQKSTALSYNSGLCAERGEDINRALGIYQQMPSEPYVRDALARIETNRQALAELAARKAWVSGRQK